jgi:hypothetical protein
MTNRNKRFLLWFVSFGKIKAGILHFLFLCIVYLIFFIVLDLLISSLTGNSFNIEWKKNLPFSFFFFASAPFISWRFYDVAIMQLKDYQKLEKKGLTKADLTRIAFVKRWQIIRRSGILRYCLFHGGLIAGMLLLFPISFFMFLKIKTQDGLFTDLSEMVTFMAKNIILSYIAGLIIYRFKWLYNERKFMRLTNPVS